MIAVPFQQCPQSHAKHGQFTSFAHQKNNKIHNIWGKRQFRQRGEENPNVYVNYVWRECMIQYGTSSQ